jgi:hypothetical protein
MPRRRAEATLRGDQALAVASWARGRPRPARRRALAIPPGLTRQPPRRSVASMRAIILGPWETGSTAYATIGDERLAQSPVGAAGRPRLRPEARLAVGAVPRPELVEPAPAEAGHSGPAGSPAPPGVWPIDERLRQARLTVRPGHGPSSAYRQQHQQPEGTCRPPSSAPRCPASRGPARASRRQLRRYQMPCGLDPRISGGGRFASRPCPCHARARNVTVLVGFARRPNRHAEGWPWPAVGRHNTSWARPDGVTNTPPERLPLREGVVSPA